MPKNKDLLGHSKETFRPKRSLGQNFLVDDNIARKIIRHLAPNPEDVILEIGPGFGVLTDYLMPAVKKVIAVEIDRNLTKELQKRFGKENNFKLILGDFLRVEMAELCDPREKLRVLGNIPYHLTSPVIFKIFKAREFVHDMTLMIQREVAQRIVASPGSKEYGILSVFSQLYSEPRILFQVSKNVFNPKPEIDSAVVRWDFSKGLDVVVKSEDTLQKVIHGVFQQRRKMLRRSLKHILSLSVTLDALNFNLARRPEDLSPGEMVKLSNLIYQEMSKQ
ncbi:MAG: 16S rRNA (adenine(1518)-N(6)/adenine(1519)-N(6))-dimethyltransferase RsmA [bacterium]